jgi:hypothetical protein
MVALMNSTTADSTVFSGDFNPAYANAVRKYPFTRKDIVCLYVCLCLAIAAASGVASWSITTAVKSDSSAYDLSLSTGGVTTIHKDPYGPKPYDVEVPTSADTPVKVTEKLVTV